MKNKNMNGFSISEINEKNREYTYYIAPPTLATESIKPGRYYVVVPDRGPSYIYSVNGFILDAYKKTVQEYSFDGCVEKDICIGDMKTFFKSKEQYSKLSIPHKRGIILYGPPGTGKSAIALTMEVEAIEMGIPVFRVGNANEMEAISSQDDNYSKMVIIEEIERYKGDLSLNVDDLPSNTFVVGTTNEPGLMHERVVKRPGRFDRIIKIDRMTPGMLKVMAAKYNLSDHLEKLKSYPVITPAQMAEMSLRLNLYGYTADDAIGSVIKEFYRE